MNSDFRVPDFRVSPSLQFPGFRLDLSNQCLWQLSPAQASATRIDLPPKTFAVLRHLVEHAQRLVSSDALLEAVWPNVHVQPEVLKGHVAAIRRALGDDAAQPRYVETQRGRGYRFIAPVDTFAVGAQSGFFARRAERFVGRTPELDALLAAHQRARAGTRQIVFVTGEAGIGKTTLIDEFLAGAPPGDAWVLGGGCVEGYGGTEPYYPVLEALGRLCRGADGKAAMQALVSIAPTWAVLMPAHVPVAVRESLLARTLGAGRQRMMREICDLLQALARARPLLLVLDDLHWADASTIDMLSALARLDDPLRLMLVAAYRSDEAASVEHPVLKLHHALLRRGACEAIDLAPLKSESIGHWLTHGANLNPLDEELADLVAARSGGNPLFMQAILEHLHEQALVEKTPRGWYQCAPAAQLRDALPNTIAQVIEMRIRRLPPDALRALETASVAGLTFMSATTAEAAAMTFETFESLCGDLARRGQFIRLAGIRSLPDGTGAQLFSFTHALVRSVFYDRQGQTRRSASHRSIGERLERLFLAGYHDGIAAELGWHFADAQQWDKALDYLRVAAQTAKLRYAYREALTMLDQGDTFIEHLPADLRPAQRIELAEARAALYAAAHDPQAVDAYRTLHEQAIQLGKTGAQLRALLGLAYVLGWNDQVRSVVRLDDALRLAASFPDRRVGAATQVECNVRRIWAQGWNAAGAQQCVDALAALREIGDPVSIAKAQLEHCMLLMVSTHYRTALDTVQAGYCVLHDQALRQPCFDISRAMWMTRLGVPWALMSLGDLGRSLDEFDRGIQIFHDNGNYFAARTLQVYRGWLLVHTMDFEIVVDLDRQFAEAADHSASDVHTRERAAFLPPQQRVWTILAGLAHAGLGESAAAQARFADAEQHMEREPIMFDWYWRLALEWGWANLALACRDLKVAQRRARRLLERALATDERTWQALAWETMASVSLNEGDLERAMSHLDAAFSATDGFETPLANWRLHRTAARLHEARGDISRAECARRRCVEARAQLAGSLSPDAGFGRRLAEQPAD
ncbi:MULTISPECIES: AAA family ATPase [Paraburkholderia]|uniref:ATP-binding protein n=1 Tax=Paraburkholderia TaxID=1822464 RepID=UPI00224D8AD1|nr:MULTISPECIES: AAA family ATPase [Paraburkholderia]MCX4161295.1 AAA family ATPase [Paraburkholderia megapolitana]MDN7156791.1 AAA family ATPase [Paraburkholderia sp. CHISQ3]MDQ6493836.1 AAA family ATPase [Paraburkholderia megapolitana]